MNSDIVLKKSVRLQLLDGSFVFDRTYATVFPKIANIHLSREQRCALLARKSHSNAMKVARESLSLFASIVAPLFRKQ